MYLTVRPNARARDPALLQNLLRSLSVRYLSPRGRSTDSAHAQYCSHSCTAITATGNKEMSIFELEDIPCGGIALNTEVKIVNAVWGAAVEACGLANANKI